MVVTIISARFVHSADALRLLLIERFGGFYADLDFVILKSLTGLHNVIASDLGFDRYGHTNTDTDTDMVIPIYIKPIPIPILPSRIYIKPIPIPISVLKFISNRYRYR